MPRRTIFFVHQTSSLLNVASKSLLFSTNSYYQKIPKHHLPVVVAINQQNINQQNIMTRYDEIEKRFGISSYASTHEGFAAVVKGRYSDFVVHEGEYVIIMCTN